MHQKVKLNRQKKNKKKKWTTVAIHDWKKTQQTGEKRKLKIFDYSEQDTRKNRNWNKPGRTVSPFDSIGSSSDINRTASNFLNASEKVQKIKKNLLRQENDADIAKDMPETLELVYQGMLENTDTKEQPAHISYKDMGNLEFQILLTNN